MPITRSAIAVMVLMFGLWGGGAVHAQTEEAAQLAAQAAQLERNGKYSEAIALAERALAIRESTLGADHPELAQFLEWFAALHLQQARYPDAARVYGRALTIYEKAFGAEHVRLAVSLAGLGLTYNYQGRFADAEPFFRRAIAIREKAQGIDHPDLARALTGLATALRERGRFAEAEPIFKRAIAVREHAFGNENPDIAYTLGSLGFLYYRQGRFEEAEPLYRRALTIREKALGPDHPLVAATLHDLALLYRSQRRFDDAEPLEKRALVISQAALGPDHPSVALSLYDLATLYRAQGRNVEALQLYERALAIREHALGSQHPDMALTLTSLAEVYGVMGRYADAESHALRAMTIWQKANGADNPQLASALTNLGALYRLQRRYAESEVEYRRALTIRQSSFGSSHRFVASSRNDLARLYYDQKRYADALQQVRPGIKDASTSLSVALPVLFGAATKGIIRRDEALADGLVASQLGSRSATAGAVTKLAIRLAAGSDRLAEMVRSDQDLSAESDALDKALLVALGKPASMREVTAEEEMRERISEIGRERDDLQRVLDAEFPDYVALSRPQPLSLKEAQSLLARDEALVAFAVIEAQSYVFAVTRDAAEWKMLPSGAAELARKVASFRAGLDPRMTLDDSVLARAGIERRLFDLTNARELHQLLLGPVDALIKDKRHLLVVPAGALSALPFHLLVTENPPAPIPSVTDKFTAATAASYRNAAWLIKRQAVTVLPSIASLKVLRGSSQNVRAPKPLIGFGDPVFGPEQSSHLVATRSLTTPAYADLWLGARIDRTVLSQALPAIPETADELRAIAAKVGASLNDIHLGADASESTVKRAPLADYRIVYFATHGLVAGDVEGLGEPSLALTIPALPSDLDDGLLTASEIAQLKLNADWVVLSACNTAAGDKPGADALSGLARAFFYAGARALLVTHWPLASAASAQFTMTTFDILNGDPQVGRAEALRRAMLAFLTDPTAPPSFAYPAIWGAYSLVGEGRVR
jgi:CHAT domain-containing protein/Flp pilus assembly protein TadD